MKVKFITATTYSSVKYAAGQVADIKAKEADVLVAKGFVTKVQKK